MKKFSKVKYFGAVAAALLAVAPIAAPVVSQVASPAVAQAAVADNYADALNNSFANSSNITLPANVGGSYFAGTTEAGEATEVTSGTKLGAALLKSGVKLDDKLSHANLRFSFSGLENLSAEQLATQLGNSATTSYTVTIIAYEGANEVARKTVTVTLADSSKATVAPSTVKVNTNVSDLLTQTSLAGAVTLQDRNGNSISLNGGDFKPSTNWATAPGASGQDLANIKFYDNKPAATDGKWANPGQLYQVSEIANPSSPKFSSVNWAQVAKASNSLVTIVPDGSATPAQVYIYRPVTVQTGNNDQQFYPLFKYTYATGSADASPKVVSYTDGQTIELNPSDASALHFYTAAQGTKYSDIAAKLASVFQNSGANKNFVALQDATVNSQGKPAGEISDLNLTTTAPGAFTEANVRNAIGNDLYKAGTYYISVTAKNKANLTSTVKIPIVIGNAANAPVAVSFTPYTEIVKGAAFDKFAGVQFQNSASDSSVVPESSVSVSGNVDTTTAGTYTLTYTVKNNQGNTSTFTRTVVVTAGALTESNASGVVYINNASGAKVYSDTATSKETGNTLDNTTAWKYSSVVKDNAGKIVAYNLGGKQYVKAADVATSPVKAQAGVFTVHYPANAKWSIAVYNSDLKVIKLIPANSTWATFGTKTLKDGKSYYSLGGNQFARTDYGFWNAK